jgi:alkanesulfonate monooxygenase SsuD/methylene tetrahydromethanopterin reductase-like flavin-dependent oxidoreductase (luciferase family)
VVAAKLVPSRFTSIWARDLSGVTAKAWLNAIVRLDSAGWPLVILEPGTESDPLDTLSVAAYGFAMTQRIALCATIDPDTVEPFTLARGLATLDHMSGGRSAWRLGASSHPARAAELVDVTRRLLLSWREDALVEEVAGGMLSKSDAVTAISHRGPHFTVKGPLNIPRPPQGTVPLIALAHDTPGSLTADVVLGEESVIAVDLAGAAKSLDALPPPAMTSLKSLLMELRT